ncbi:cyclin-T1-4-like isoform X2 [Salvia splendens]|uniref:cyclin-T1-4-like isoform X2 n=1 Tax=Salvia splendens TaxID=180675 RepID=UPI001C27EEED|nr:cyclin-T1-4-like isoform X2 [Salvia splendens]
MSFVRPQQPRGGKFHRDNRSSCARNSNMAVRATGAAPNYYGNFGTHDYNNYHDFTQTYRLDGLMYDRRGPDFGPSPKRRKTSTFSAESTGSIYQQQQTYQYDLANRADSFKPSRYYNACADAQLVCKSSAAVAETRSGDANLNASSASKCDRLKFEDEEVVFMSRDDIEKSSPSRKDGIDQLHETYLRYSYCSFLQNVGARLHLFLIATAVLFLASKSEETPCALNDVLKASCEVLHKQDFSLLSYMLPIDWFEKYRERMTDAEQLVLTTLNFELNVQHPFESLTSTLQKLGFAQSVLVNMALDFVREGLRSSLWLQFKPHQIAAGAAYLAAKFLNMNLTSCDSIWNEFHTPPSVLKDVAHQLLELL